MFAFGVELLYNQGLFFRFDCRSLTVPTIDLSAMSSPITSPRFGFFPSAPRSSSTDRSGFDVMASGGDSEKPVESAASPGQKFSFKVADLVLVKWNDGMVYFAKIKRIDNARGKCTVVFDDKSQDEASFSQIHSGKPRAPCSLSHV